MGRLINLSKIKTQVDKQGLDASWYFPNARYNAYSGRGLWEFDVETGFPFLLAIHFEEFKDKEKVRIRQFIERSLLGAVFYQYDDKSYSYVSSYKRENGRDKKFKSNVQHGYHVFRFEEENDRALFMLRFGGETEMSERHPDRSDITEESIEQARMGYFDYY